jgi:anti-anti-sigma factor
MAHEPYELLDVRHTDPFLVLRVEVTSVRHPQAAQDLGAEVRTAVQRHPNTGVVLDLQKVDFLGSTAFAVLLGLARDLHQHGTRLALCGLHEDVARGSSIVGLERVLSVHATEADALKALAAGSIPNP